jgi:signal transduction histidine kinase
MADALLIVDANGCLVRLNRAARQLLYLTSDTSIVLGKPLEPEQLDRWPAGGRAIAEALVPIITALRRTQEPQEREVDLPGASPRTLSFSATPLHEPHGAFGGGVVIFRDVTERRIVERLKDETLSMASHDLRTPATVIKAQAQLLRRRVVSKRIDTDEFDEGLTMIVDQSDRLARLLNLLLDLSRIEAGRLELIRAPTDLVVLVHQLAAALQVTTERHRLVVVAPPAVIGDWDQRRLEEVVQNLLANAIKYSPQGGDIDVRVDVTGDAATVRVRDPGVGIAPDDLRHIFERFYRGRAIRRLEGSGLGLYISGAIVAAHGGHIWADSEGVGRGSTFAFSLPLTSDDQGHGS